MKKLKQNQLGPWCTFCPPKTERAVYREDGFASTFCCHTHKNELLKLEMSRQTGGRVTEADRQTWMKL